MHTGGHARGSGYVVVRRVAAMRIATAAVRIMRVVRAPVRLMRVNVAAGRIVRSHDRLEVNLQRNVPDRNVADAVVRAARVHACVRLADAFDHEREVRKLLVADRRDRQHGHATPPGHGRRRKADRVALEVSRRLDLRDNLFRARQDACRLWT